MESFALPGPPLIAQKRENYVAARSLVELPNPWPNVLPLGDLHQHAVSPPIAALVRHRIAPPVDFDLGKLHGKENEHTREGDGG